MSSPLAIKTSEIASRDIGKLEIPRGSNRGPRIDDYQVYTNLLAPNTPLYNKSGILIPGFAYCASAVSMWIYEAAQILNVAPIFKKSGSALGLAHNNPTLIINKNNLTPEDVGCIGVNIHSDKIHGHAFWIIGFDEQTGKLTTVDPNSDLNGGREGTGVYLLNRRNINDPERYCYIRVE
jgi:hypothetical protein